MSKSKRAEPAEPEISSELRALAPPPDDEADPGAAGAPGADAAGSGRSDDEEPAREFDPAAEKKRELAAAAAGWLVGFTFDALNQKWPELQWDEAAPERGMVHSVLVPLFVKYDVTPKWLERWREEAAAVVVIGGVAYQGYQRVRAARAKPASAAPAGQRFTATRVEE